MNLSYLTRIQVRSEIENPLAHPLKDMTYTQIKSRDIPWIFFKRKSTIENDANADEFFQVPVEALLKVDKLAEYDSLKIHSDSLICFLNQLQFIRYKKRNHTFKYRLTIFRGV